MCLVKMTERGKKICGWSKIKKRSPKIILQCVGIPAWPTETHNPGCVKIRSGKNKDLKCLKS